MDIVYRKLVLQVAPLRGRGLKRERRPSGNYFARRSLTGAWIETKFRGTRSLITEVAPLRGRGLKQCVFFRGRYDQRSLPYGGVD